MPYIWNEGLEAGTRRRENVGQDPPRIFDYRRDILTLLNGDDLYFNRGLHVITMRWGKVYAPDVFEDSQEVARGLAAQAASGLKEAVAEPIVS